MSKVLQQALVLAAAAVLAKLILRAIDGDPTPMSVSQVEEER